MKPLDVLLVAGARPNFMKIAPIYWALRDHAADHVRVTIVHTGQHYDARMSDDFFRDLRLPAPDVNLGVGSASHAEQTARVMSGFERVLLKRRPDVVVVVGDVNSTAACALVTAKIELDGPRRRPLLAHVEAGLRSRDRTMPEEINRLVTDAISDLLLTTCRDADDNLRAEGIAPDKIRFVGNPMIDSLRRCLADAAGCSVLERLGLAGRGYGLVTLHRPSNVDDPERLREILAALREIARETRLLLPVHPRTQARLERFGLAAGGEGIVLVEPLAYLEMLQVMQAASFVLTDSGGIQEETTALGVACVTLRENTERPVTIHEGTNVLAGVTRRGILAGLAEARRKVAAGTRVPELWDGRAGERIAAALTAAEELPA
ncbi:MAG: UDP-N-acetylglucosamine 2-epimerase (non-hydrolyzing) [Thermodesulfobacteriota bacterium]